jgi:hypothetical protein
MIVRHLILEGGALPASATETNVRVIVSEMDSHGDYS